MYARLRVYGRPGFHPGRSDGGEHGQDDGGADPGHAEDAALAADDGMAQPGVIPLDAAAGPHARQRVRRHVPFLLVTGELPGGAGAVGAAFIGQRLSKQRLDLYGTFLN